MPTALNVPLRRVLPPPEPLRVSMSDQEMERLVESIKQIGLLYPLAVVPVWGDGAATWRYTPDEKLGDKHGAPDSYEVVDGHRRRVALERLGAETVLVLIFENAEQAKHAMMLDANVCREDVTPFEEGVQFLELATKHEWSMDQLISTFRKSEDYINDRVDVVRRDQRVAEAVRDRTINLGQAKEVLKAPDEMCRTMLLEQAAVHGATIKALHEMRRNYIRDVQTAQGELPMNAPAHAAPAAIIPPETCLWCGKDHSPENLVVVKVHQYELQDLKAVLERFSPKALLTQLGGGGQ